MAVTRADKEAELAQLEAAFKGSDSAILVDYKGMSVPQVTELRRQIRTAKGGYKVVKNTIAKRALKGTSFETLEKYFEGTTAVAYTKTDPVALAKTLTTFVKTAPTLTIKAAIVQGRAVKPAEVSELAALPGKPELAYNSVLTTIRILEKKGYIKHVKDGRAHVYVPVVARQDASRSEIRHLVSRFFKNSHEQLVLNVLEDRGLDPKELKRLREMLEGGAQK